MVKSAAAMYVYRKTDGVKTIHQAACFKSKNKNK